jgi:hypothetical protein
VRLPRLAAPAALAACVAACTPSRGDVVSWNQVRLEALRDRLQKIARSLPPPGEAAKYAGHPPVEPLPRATSALDNATNTDFLMEDELSSPRSAAPPFPSSHLRRVLGLLEANEANAAARSERDPVFRDEVKHVLALRYVVALRVNGKLVEAYVADLATGSIRATVTLPFAASDDQTRAMLTRALAAATGGTFD